MPGGSHHDHSPRFVSRRLQVLPLAVPALVTLDLPPEPHRALRRPRYLVDLAAHRLDHVLSMDVQRGADLGLAGSLHLYADFLLRRLGAPLARAVRAILRHPTHQAGQDGGLVVDPSAGFPALLRRPRLPAVHVPPFTY